MAAQSFWKWMVETHLTTSDDEGDHGDEVDEVSTDDKSVTRVSDKKEDGRGKGSEGEHGASSGRRSVTKEIHDPISPSHPFPSTETLSPTPPAPVPLGTEEFSPPSQVSDPSSYEARLWSHVNTSVPSGYRLRDEGVSVKSAPFQDLEHMMSAANPRIESASFDIQDTTEGTVLFVADPDGDIYPAVLLFVHEKKWFIHYLGWDRDFDEWIDTSQPADRARLKARLRGTGAWWARHTLGSWRVGSTIEFGDGHSWTMARVVEVSKGRLNHCGRGLVVLESPTSTPVFILFPPFDKGEGSIHRVVVRCPLVSHSSSAGTSVTTDESSSVSPNSTTTLSSLFKRRRRLTSS